MNLSQSITPSWAANLTRALPTVFIVDDDVSVRESLELLVRFSGWHPELFATGRDFLSRPRASGPSCLVCDVTLPDLNGLDLQQLVADRYEMPIIFISGYGDVPMTVRAMKAGALRRAAKVRVLQDRYELLTRREREVMSLVVAGKLNKQVAGDLGISEITVKAHRGKMIEKMKADSLADLVRIAATLRIAPIADA
jgi:FixJ family two-component response regulator